MAKFSIVMRDVANLNPDNVLEHLDDILADIDELQANFDTLNDRCEDLLEACKAILELVGDFRPDPETLNLIEVAVAKAEEGE